MPLPGTRPLPLLLDHPLLDIRCRSLRSIVFKLSNDLLSSSDLVGEKEFLAHLLEWFNFEEWALESQVLTLLSQLSEVCMWVWLAAWLWFFDSFI